MGTNTRFHVQPIRDKKKHYPPAPKPQHAKPQQTRRNTMDRIDQYNHDYQNNIERTDRLRETMWNDHDQVVSALTGIELTREEARQLAALKTACKQGHPALMQFAAETLLSMFDDELLDYVSELSV